MAVRITNPGIVYQDANVTVSTTLTISFWAYISVDTNALTSIVYLGTVSTANNLIGLDADGTTLMFYSAADAVIATGSALSLNQWYHMAYVRNGSSSTVYLDGVSSITRTVSPAVDNTYLTFGLSAGSSLPFDGRIASVKLWEAALSLDEIKQEARQYAPIRTTNLRSVYPFLKSTDLVDYNSTGYSLLTGGTVSTEDGPPIPWRQGRAKRYVRLTIAAATSLLFHPNPMRYMLVR